MWRNLLPTVALATLFGQACILSIGDFGPHCSHGRLGCPVLEQYRWAGVGLLGGTNQFQPVPPTSHPTGAKGA